MNGYAAEHMREILDILEDLFTLSYSLRCFHMDARRTLITSALLFIRMNAISIILHFSDEMINAHSLNIALWWQQ